MNNKENCTEELFVALGGNKIEYPARIALMKPAADSKITYALMGEKLVFYYNGEACGYALNDLEKNLAIITKNNYKVTPAFDVIQKLEHSTDVEITFEKALAVLPILKIKYTSTALLLHAQKEIAKQSIEKFYENLEESDKNEIKKREKWLRDGGIPEYAIQLFMKHIVKHKGISPFEPSYVIVGPQIEIAIAAAVPTCGLHENPLFVGPASTGKNRCQQTFANLMDMQTVDLVCSAGDGKDELLGHLSMKTIGERPDKDAINLAFKRLVKSINFSEDKNKQAFDKMSTEEKIKFIESMDDDFDYSILFDAMRSQTAEIVYEPSIMTASLEMPMIINFDEVNMLRPNITSSLHSALDTRRKLLINNYRNIDIHEEVIFMGTMNEGYEGTVTMNEAFDSRWKRIPFDAPNSIFDILKMEVPMLSDSSAKFLDVLHKKIKDVYEDPSNIATPFSKFHLRMFISAAKNIVQGNDVIRAVEQNIVQQYPSKVEQEALRSIIDLLH